MLTRNIIHITLLFCLLFSFGCSGKVPLSGTVTFSDDGSPVPCGAVFLETETFQAMGSIKNDGTYVVGSTGLDDGIPKGTYKVSIRGAESTTMVKGPGGTQVERRKALIDPKYQNPDSSGLSLTVDGKSKTFDLKVDRAK